MGVATWFVASDHSFKASCQSNVTGLAGHDATLRLNAIDDGGKRFNVTGNA
jgi:hypothetical protein